MPRERVQRPVCRECGKSENTTFPLSPKTAGKSFGEICAECDKAGE